MDTNIVFRKTAKGLEEIERRSYRLPPRERLLLIQIDGRRNLAVLSGKAGGEREGLDTAGRLLAGGFIETVPPSVTAAAVHRPAPTRPATAAPPWAAPAPRPEPHPVAATPAGHGHHHRPAEARQGGAAARQIPTPRPASWLTSTVAHLTNLFNADQEPGLSAGAPRNARAPESVKGRAPGAAVRPSTRPADPQAATVIHAPLFDTQGSSPDRREQTLSATMVHAPLRGNAIPDSRMAASAAVAAPPPPAPARPAPEPDWLDIGAEDDIPMLDVTAAMDAGSEGMRPNEATGAAGPFAAAIPGHRLINGQPVRSGHDALPRPGESRLGRLSAGDALVAPAPQGATPDCPSLASCPGCAHCPVNSVSSARSFMKEQLVRYSGNARNPLLYTLDQSRTLADLQRQFEAWLRELLRTASGCAEAPALAAELQRMLSK